MTDVTLTVFDVVVVLGLFVGALGLMLLAAELVLTLFPRLERFLTRVVLGIDPDGQDDSPLHVVVTIEEPDRFVDLAALHLNEQEPVR